MKSRDVMFGLSAGLCFFALMSCGGNDAGADAAEQDEEATVVEVGDGKDDTVSTLSTKIGAKFAFNAGIERLELSKCDKSKSDCNMSPDFVNAYWLLYLSELAYKPKTDIQNGLKKIGLKPAEFVFFNNEYSGAQAYYFEVENVGIVTFRGTQEEQMVDFTSDANTVMQNGMHAGFAEQFRSS